MKIHEAKITATVLGKEVGWSWPFLMARCLRRKNGIFKQTHWSEEEGPEVEYIQRLAIVAAAFLELQEKYPQDRAIEIMRKVIVPIGLSESMNSLLEGEQLFLLALNYHDKGNKEKAVEYCTNAVKIFKDLDRQELFKKAKEYLESFR